MTKRVIQLGRGTAVTVLTPHQIAAVRAERVEGYADQLLFLSTFDRFRRVAPEVAKHPMDLEMLYLELSANVPVMQAAMIEALASLRAEGVRL